MRSTASQACGGKASTIFCLITAAVVSAIAIPTQHTSNATTLMESRQAGNAYRIAVYQNAQCTGDSIPFSGDADGCFIGLGAGGAGLQLLALDADGQLSFYNQLGCPMHINAEVAVFNTDGDQTGTDCKPLHGNPVSFFFENV